MENENTSTEEVVQQQDVQSENDSLANDFEELANNTVPIDGSSENGSPDVKVGEEVDSANSEKQNYDSQKKAEDYEKERALVERGIRAGLSINDILQIPSSEVATKMIEMAEKANGIEQPKEESHDESAGSPADEWGSTIKEMEDDGEYDPNIMKLLKGMHSELAALRSAGLSAEKNGFFEKQFGSLDEGLRSHIDAASKSKLRSKFDMLEAGYKAVNADIPRERIFNEAAKLAIGDIMERAGEERKARSLDQRRNLVLARPSGDRGQRGGAVSADNDPFADFVEMMG